MTEEHLTLLIVRNAVAEMTNTDQEKLQAAAVRIRAVLADYPAGHGAMALALIGAEMAAQNT